MNHRQGKVPARASRDQKQTPGANESAAQDGAESGTDQEQRATAVTYTNRKGVTYSLYHGLTRSGKPRYLFSRESKGEAVEQIPEGYAIRESVNGIVSLTRVRPQAIRTEELAALETAVHRHRHADNYRVQARHRQIEVYERIGPDPEAIIGLLKKEPLFNFRYPLEHGLEEAVREPWERTARFEVVLRFILTDAEKRTFRVERRSYRSGGDEWIPLGLSGSIQKLARQTIPQLGTDAFFEMM